MEDISKIEAEPKIKEFSDDVIELSNIIIKQFEKKIVDVNYKYIILENILLTILIVLSPFVIMV